MVRTATVLVTRLTPQACAERLRTLVDTTWLGTGGGRLVPGRVSESSVRLWLRGSPYPLLLRARITPTAEGSAVTCRCSVSPDGLAILIVWFGILVSLSIALWHEGVDEMPALLLRHNGMLIAGMVTTSLGVAGVVAAVISLLHADDERLLVAFLRDALEAAGADGSPAAPPRGTFLHGRALSWAVSACLSALLWWPLGLMMAQERAFPHDDRAGIGAFMTLGYTAPLVLLFSLLLRGHRSISPLQLLVINSAPLALVLLEFLARERIWSWR